MTAPANETEARSDGLAALFDIAGKTVLVTGTASGIGRAVADGLAQLGARVFAADIAPQEPSPGDAGTTPVRHLACDVSDESQVAAAFAVVLEEAGGVDVVFSNAGIAGVPTPTDELSLSDWRQVNAVNLDGAFLVAREAIRAMKPAGRGKIIFTASTWGMVGTGGADLAAYAASKGGVVNLVRQLAIECAEFGITVNGIAPSAVRSAIAEGFYEDEAAVAAMLRDVPLGRVVEADQLLGLAVYLASSASDFMTGHNIVFDGGFLAH